MDWDNPHREWFEFHREDYRAVKRRLRATRNVVLRGRTEAAVDVLEKACVNAVLSIQTGKDRHERAFTAYYAGGASLEDAAGMTVYGNQKAGWLHGALANFDFHALVEKVRDDVRDAQAYLVDGFTGLSWVKAGFALAMGGIWEVACPDSRTKDMLGIDGRIRTRSQYRDALEQIDDALNVDEPLFVKQWVLYDSFAEEHARHMPFFREALGPTVV